MRCKDCMHSAYCPDATEGENDHCSRTDKFIDISSGLPCDAEAFMSCADCEFGESCNNAVK